MGLTSVSLSTYNSGSLTATYADNPTGAILALPQAMKDVTFGIYPSAGSFALYVTTADDPATTTNWTNTDTVFSTASVFSIGLTITGIKVIPQASGAAATFRVRGQS